MLKLVTQYYGVWEPSPTAAQRLAFLENVLMPKITFEQLQTSLKLRGTRVVLWWRAWLELCDAHVPTPASSTQVACSAPTPRRS